jgi:hypothetical protein
VALALETSCSGSDPRSFALGLLSAHEEHVLVAQPPVPPINMRVDVRLADVASGNGSGNASGNESGNERGESYREWPLDELLRAMATRPVRRVLGNYRSTSPIYRLELEGGLQIGFKPAIPGQETWWRHDVVAYRLARVLGIQARVPPAVARRVRVDELGDAVREDGLITAPDDHDSVPGVAIFWLPVLRTTYLDWSTHRAEWQPWMEARGRMPTGRDAERAAEISSVIVFDYLQANEDRWNDANIRADENEHLVYRDNNVGWFLAKMQDLTWGRETLGGTQRFSRALVDALERATPDALREELARADDAGLPLTDERVIRAYGARQREVLRYVRRLRERYGDESVLPWP